MKSALLALPVFAAFFAAIFLFLTFLSGVYFRIETSHAVGELGLGVLTPHIAAALPAILTVTTVLSLFFLLFSLRKKKAITFPVYISAILAASLFYGGLFLLFSGIDSSEETAPKPISSPFEAGYIYPAGDYLFYSEAVVYEESGEAEIPGAVYQTVALVAPKGYEMGTDQERSVKQEEGEEESYKLPLLSLFRSAALRSEEETLVLKGNIFGAIHTEPRIPLGGRDSSMLSSVNPPGLIRAVAGEAGLVAGSLQGLRSSSLPFFAAAILIQVLFITISWAFVRTSRWPLFNSLIALLLIRGFFYLFSLGSGEAVRELLAGFSMEGHADLAPYALLLAVSLVFLLWNTAFHFGRKEGS